jgi:hypothetical protein
MTPPKAIKKKKAEIPFYSRKVNETGSPWDNPECIDKLGSWTVKCLALGGSLILAIIYDSNWVMVFFAMACVLLGVEIKSKLTQGAK